MAAIPLRILCLHDAGSNAQELKDALELLGNRLYTKHGGIDLVYVNSTIALDHSERVWWEAVPWNCRNQQHHDDNLASSVFSDDSSEDENDENAAVPPPGAVDEPAQESPEDDNNNNAQVYYRGLDASLQLLQQIWMSRPFWGILGVGQGAAVAALLTLMLQSSASSVVAPPSFAIFLHGHSLLPERERLSSDLDCLHLVNPTPEQSVLVEQFGGFCEPIQNVFGRSALNAMGRFILRQKKKVVGNGREIVLLQNALHLTEQQAADTIALEIAKNPPAPLMAIIRPQHVAGWQGNKRRQPGEEGGGAPCPSEFLLKRDKRPNRHKTGEGAASREHPTEQKQPSEKQEDDGNKAA